jgi:hypothetical protein
MPHHYHINHLKPSFHFKGLQTTSSSPPSSLGVGPTASAASMSTSSMVSSPIPFALLICLYLIPFSAYGHTLSSSCQEVDPPPTWTPHGSRSPEAVASSAASWQPRDLEAGHRSRYHADVDPPPWPCSRMQKMAIIVVSCLGIRVNDVEKVS